MTVALDAELAVWQAFLTRRGGPACAGGRERVLCRSLEERRAALGLRSTTDYYHYVAYHPAGAAEWERLRELLLNRETSFFRHPASFAALVELLLAETRRRQGSGDRTIRLCSAGCSTGQEAYSLAIAAVDALAQTNWEVRVLGTDISKPALARARAGRYRAFEARLPDHVRVRHFDQVADETGVWAQVKATLRSLVEFAHVDLAAGGVPGPELDVVFCQNVLIYYDSAGRETILQGLMGRLRPGGYLVLAPADAVGLQHAGLTPAPMFGAAVFRRTG